jgi:hypothetical protein
LLGAENAQSTNSKKKTPNNRIKCIFAPRQEEAELRSADGQINLGNFKLALPAQGNFLE